MNEEIYLDFDDADNPVVSVRGIKGRGCKDATRALEQALGTVREDRPTAEYREEESHAERRVIRGR